MEHAEYARTAAAQERHWWYRATQALIRQLLGSRVHESSGPVLDAGCGPGGNMAWLARTREVVGLDSSSEALRLARLNHPELRTVEGDITAMPFADASFDLGLAITVLAHVPDDRGAVHELARVTRPGGAVVLMEPAVPRLRRDHDAVTRIHRRYTLERLRGLAVGAGLTPVRATHAYSFLLPPAAVLAALHRLRRDASRASSDLERDWLGPAFGALAAAERRVLRRRDLPVGLSVLVLAERR